MVDTHEILKSFTAQKDFFIGIDSDGCVFDTMEIKQNKCFCPAIISRFGLQAVSAYARETWNFVSLYSKTRGSNRFPALLRTLELLRNRDDIRKLNINVLKLPELEKWVCEETKLSMVTLKEYLKSHDTPEMRNVFNWSAEVNKAVENMVHDVSPFLHVRDTLAEMQKRADVMVISQSPVPTLEKEWEAHDFRKYIRLIAGQEMGTKSEHIALAALGTYPADRILMIGDAPGDMKAALDNGALFFPICPGGEEKSWKRLLEEGLPNFFAGRYMGTYQQQLLDEFNLILPENPDWN